MEEQWFSAADVADRLGVAQKTVRKWIRQGDLDAWLIGGRVGYRIKESELKRFMSSRGRGQVAAEITSTMIVERLTVADT